METGWKEELVCEFTSPDGPRATHARGLLIASSLTILKEAGYYARYLEGLATVWRDAVLLATAFSWVPMEAAQAHYEACDELALDAGELEAVGDRVATRFSETFIGTLARATRSAGIEAPWIALRSLPRIWGRMYQGGAVRVVRTGPKDAFVQMSGVPLASSQYFRAASLGYCRGVAGLFVRGLYLRSVPRGQSTPDTLALRASWV